MHVSAVLLQVAQGAVQSVHSVPVSSGTVPLGHVLLHWPL